MFQPCHSSPLCVKCIVIVGSGNLTAGGLFTNVEACLSLSLDLTVPADRTFLGGVEGVMDRWSQHVEGICYRLTDDLLRRLVAERLVLSEAQLVAAAVNQRAAMAGGRRQRRHRAEQEGGEAPLFVATAVPVPPPVEGVQPEAAAQPEPAGEPEPIPVPIPVQAGAITSFVMTLQNTDVGVGQITPGTSRRSPEVFIPLLALDEDPGFWQFPDTFTPDRKWNADHRDRRNGLGKLDRQRVPMRIGVVREVNMFFNPRKKDFRLRHEALRSSGSVGDILWVRRVDPINGFEYEVQVAPVGTPLHRQLLPYCNSCSPGPFRVLSPSRSFRANNQD